MSRTQWIFIDPLDTLFFKGSEPMVAGENHEVRSVFPPAPSTLSGAICTAVLRQKGIQPARFVDSPQGISDLPLLGSSDALGIEVIGPLLHIDFKDGTGEWFIPAPANWFICEPTAIGEEDFCEVAVSVAEVPADGFSSLGLMGSTPLPAWVMNPKSQDMKGLSGYWINTAALEAVIHGKDTIRMYESIKKIRAGEPILASLKFFLDFETRVGIALEDRTRKVKKGHLYSTTQVRLQTGVRIGVGLQSDMIPSHLNEKGTLQLGGEQRVSSYEHHAEGPSFPTGQTAWIMALSIFPFQTLKEHGWEELPRVSGAILRMGGWDMKKQFHKPMKAYLPQGTVIRIGEDASIPRGFIRI
ncbi:MAG: hypothetical protein GX433_14925 [Deltaproteobacteria bacterium]|jgi:CRISPR-associated protein Cmr3|nr:hypothetical protein [Deltaproteobacteria bacterium]